MLLAKANSDSLAESEFLLLVHDTGKEKTFSGVGMGFTDTLLIPPELFHLEEMRLSGRLKAHRV